MLKILLKIALFLSPSTRHYLKKKFSFFANLVLVQSSSLKKWQIKQEKLEREYDLKADELSIDDTIGATASSCEVLVVTPTFPTKSGIVNYSSRFVSELGTLSRVRVTSSYVEAKEFQFSKGIRASFPKDKSTNLRCETLYMLGNGEHHWKTWEWILKYPGYILVHDAKIPDIPLMEGEDSSWYDLNYYDKSIKFLGRLPLHTKGIFTHSAHAAGIVRQQLSTQQLMTIPIHVLNTGHPAECVLTEGRILPKRPTIGSFGFQTENKNPLLTYSTIAYLASKADGKGLICGKIDNYNQQLAERIWLEYGNELIDLAIYSWVDKDEYDSLMSTVDVAVQLRKTTNGESSGPFTQLTGRGILTIVTDIGAFSEFPNLRGVVKIPEKISIYDLEFLLLPILEILGSPDEYTSASATLQEFYKDKTYLDCANEIFKELFR